MKYFLISFFTFIFSILSIHAQHELYFLNGDKITIDGYQISQDFSGDSIISFHHKNKIKELLLYDVFSVIDNNNVETIFYHKNEEMGFDLEVNEMKSFVLGAHHAKERYNAFGATASGFITGIGSVFIPPFNQSVFLGDFNMSLIPALPIANAGIVSLIHPSDEKINEQYPQFKDDIYFQEGYKQRARNKRVRNGIIGGISGIVTGLLISSALN